MFINNSPKVGLSHLRQTSGASHYSFNSVSTHTSVINGKKQSTTEAVSIRNGNGMKTVVKRKGNKTLKSKHRLSQEEIQNIKDRKFMPTLFTPCHKDCEIQMSQTAFPQIKKISTRERSLNSPKKMRLTRKRVKRGSK